MIRSTNGRSTTERQDPRWWERRWLAVLRDLNLIAESEQVRQLTQGYRVRQLEVSTGRIDGKVHHRELGDCSVAIDVARLTDDQWEAVLDALSSQATASAQLLAGEMPREVEQIFADAGAALMPVNASEIRQSCSCCQDDEPVCRPALTVYLAVGDMLNDDPWLLLRLRGRDRQQIIRDLGVRRSQTNGAASPMAGTGEQSLVYRAGGALSQLDDSPMLEEEIDHFWGRSRAQLQFQHHVAPPLIELVLLRRLGPPHFADDSFDVYDNFSAIYRTVTDASLALAYASEDDATLDDGDNGG